MDTDADADAEVDSSEATPNSGDIFAPVEAPISLDTFFDGAPQEGTPEASLSPMVSVIQKSMGLKHWIATTIACLSFAAGGFYAGAEFGMAGAEAQSLPKPTATKSLAHESVTTKEIEADPPAPILAKKKEPEPATEIAPEPAPLQAAQPDPTPKSDPVPKPDEQRLEREPEKHSSRDPCTAGLGRCTSQHDAGKGSVTRQGGSGFPSRRGKSHRGV